MKIFFSLIIGLILGLIIFNYIPKNTSKKTIITQNIKKEMPFDVYTIENLSKTNFKSNPIEIIKDIADEEKMQSFLFRHKFSPNPNKPNETKDVTGIINLPKNTKNAPLIILLRGYIDQKIYSSGMGTKRVGEYLANQGYITIAPDFLGYGQSDSESSDILESRFQTYVTALSILNSLDQINLWNKKDIFIWAHSNGGQIALTLLEITGKPIKTVLWAPVSKYFPYSVLYYTDESEDRGKLIRKKLSEFEKDYDPDLYSFTNFIEKINKDTKILLIQGTNDDAIPVSWSNEIVSIIKKSNIDIKLLIQKGADHNLNPLWEDSILKSIEFFQKE